MTGHRTMRLNLRDRRSAKKRAPWASVFVKAGGGLVAFQDRRDALDFKAGVSGCLSGMNMART